jgi:hypothetical protein
MLLRLLRTRYLTTNTDEPLTSPLTRDFVEDLTPADELDTLYLQPDGTSYYLQPDGSSYYLQPTP